MHFDKKLRHSPATKTRTTIHLNILPANINTRMGQWGHNLSQGQNGTDEKRCENGAVRRKRVAADFYPECIVVGMARCVPSEIDQLSVSCSGTGSLYSTFYGLLSFL